MYIYLYPTISFHFYFFCHRFGFCRVDRSTSVVPGKVVEECGAVAVEAGACIIAMAQRAHCTLISLRGHISTLDVASSCLKLICNHNT